MWPLKQDVHLAQEMSSSAAFWLYKADVDIRVVGVYNVTQPMPLTQSGRRQNEPLGRLICQEGDPNRWRIHRLRERIYAPLVRILVWNMKGAFGATDASHAAAWSYLRDQSFDVALLQETRNPADFADWCSTVWHPKYAKTKSRRILWGTAVISRSTELIEPKLDDRFPWLRELQGSTAIARIDDDPAWFASVHAHTAPVASTRLEEVGSNQVPVSTTDSSIWETDLIPFELRRLFGDETFIWGGDLNSAVVMDENPRFTGGNGKLRQTWKEAGSFDLRLGFHEDEQQTFFAPNRKPYQLDHVFADEATSRRVTSWRVDRTPVELDPSLSDHAPIVIDIAP